MPQSLTALYQGWDHPARLFEDRSNFRRVGLGSDGLRFDAITLDFAGLGQSGEAVSAQGEFRWSTARASRRQRSAMSARFRVRAHWLRSV